MDFILGAVVMLGICIFAHAIDHDLDAYLWELIKKGWAKINTTAPKS